MEYKNAIVADSKGNKVEFVLVTMDETGEATPLHYELAAGEQLVYEDVAVANSMLKPRWTGKGWKEMASDKELEAAKPETPPNEPSEVDLALMELTMFTAMQEERLNGQEQAIVELSIILGGVEQ